MGPKVPLRPVTIALLAQPLGQVENDRDGQDVILSGERDEGLPRLDLHVGRVHDRELPAREPPARDEMQRGERVGRGRLVVLIVRDEAAAIVRRQHLGGLEVLRGKRGLPAAGRSDQDHERQLGHDQLHRVNTPICVGEPTAGSASPTGRNRTE